MKEDLTKVGPSIQTQLMASLVAGFTASAFSLPFDLLKSRLRKLNVIMSQIFFPHHIVS